MANYPTNVNPWKGLNFYKEGEILYGRNSEIESLSHYIFNNTQTVLYGKSGIGKSSILNAGIFPLARKKGMLPVPIRFDHNNETPYIEQIRSAIVKSGADIHEILPVIDAGKETLWEYLHRNIFFDKEGKRVQLLIVLDQFEEMFTLQQDEKTKLSFFQEIADLINDITPLYIINADKKQVSSNNGSAQEVTGSLDNIDIDLDIDEPSELAGSNKYLKKIDYHIVFTLREDFLSYLERYTAYIPSMKSNRYALMPLNEEQAAEIIMRPVEGLIDKEVAELIIQKVTGRHDFILDGIPEIEVDAAVLSLYLSRIFIKKGDKDTITADIVDQFSDDIIKDFYEESVANLPQDEIEKLENKLLTSDGRRNNFSRNDLIKREGVSYGVIKTLVDEKKLLRQFSYQDDIRVEFMHDILCPIVNERIENREEAKKKAEEQRQQEEHQRKILAEEQRKREEIEARAKADRERMEAEAKLQRQRTRRIVLVFVMLAAIAGISVTAYYYMYKKEYSSYYTSYELVEGWPVGVGQLSANELVHHSLYYKLSHTGSGRKNTDIEVCSSNARLSKTPRIHNLLNLDGKTSDVNSVEFLKLLSQVKYIHFESGEKGKINKEVVKGEDNSVLFYVNYFHLETEGQAWVQYVSSHGQTMKICENGLDRIKLTWVVSDENNVNNGRISSLMYYDELGVSQSTADGINGFSIRYSEDGRTTTRYALDEYGRSKNINKMDYNVITIISNHDTLDLRYSHVLSISDSLIPVKGPNGYWRELQIGDDYSMYLPNNSKCVAKKSVVRDYYGNVLQTKIEGLTSSTQPAIVNYTYSTTGFVCSEMMLNQDGTPFMASDSIYLRKWQYGKNDDVISEEYYSFQNEKVYSHVIIKQDNVVRDELYDLKNKDYPVIIRIDSTMNDYHSVTFYTSANQPINIAADGSVTPFHRMMVKTTNHTKTTCYYKYNPDLHMVYRQFVEKDDYGTVLSYFKKVETFDDDNNVMSYQIFDEQDHIVKSMMFFFQNGQSVARAAMGIEGTPIRCPEWEEEGFGYYKIYYSRDFFEGYSGIKAVNEWGANSIFFDEFVGEYNKVEYFDFNGWYAFDTERPEEEDRPYRIIKSYKQHIFKIDSDITNTTIPYVHILDKNCSLYDGGNGLKDGDRLIKIGQWSWKKSDALLKSEWYRLCDEPLDIEVLRPTKDGYEKMTYKMQFKDKDIEMIEYHVFALTKDELQMIKTYNK